MLAAWLERVRALHTRDLARGAAWVELPDAVDLELPDAGNEGPRQWVFPATRRSIDPKTGQRRCHHLHETVVPHAVRGAVLAAGLRERVSRHSFRHSFATQLPEDGSDIRTVQDLLGPADVSTTMIDTHVLNRGPPGSAAPPPACSEIGGGSDGDQAGLPKIGVARARRCPGRRSGRLARRLCRSRRRVGQTRRLRDAVSCRPVA
ncbi:MAG: tyrosine-type recombinase/integrase [Planctomycetes bacterium]|nr:tyrosine-type recombinase/integrase [Planctomycetota bacterium]